MELTNQQQFPIYISGEPRAFELNGQPSGAAGARAIISFSLPEAPHFVYGVRISTFYDLPSDLGANDVASWEACRRWVDTDCTAQLDISQQSIFANPTKLDQVVGPNGQYWHPFPVVWNSQGGQNFKVTLSRLTSYPTIGGQAILPQVMASLVCGQWRGDQTLPAEFQRRGA